MGLRPQMKQRGAVAVLVALSLVFFLIAAVGLALDLGRLFVNKTELQNAADACALAAARELNVEEKTLAVLTRAEDAGIAVGNRHRYDFQNDEVRFVADQDVTFSEALDGTYVTKGSASTSVAYVRCTREIPGFLQWFSQLLWLGGSSDIFPVSATAVASRGPGGPCPIPLGMCLKTAPPPCTVPGVTPDAYGLCKGQWYSGRFEASVTGNFNWLDFTPHGGGSSEIWEALAYWPICPEPGAQYHAETGEMQAVKDAWNSRFGLYKNGGKLDASTAPPDFTGYSYGPTNWPQGHDAYDDYLVRQASFASYGYPADTTAAGNKTTGLNVQNSFRTSPSGAAGPHGHGTADRRVVVMPVVDCSSWGPTHFVPASGWACALMVAPLSGPNDEVVLEYLGPAGAEDAPCGTFGQPSGAGGTGPRVPTLVQ